VCGFGVGQRVCVCVCVCVCVDSNESVVVIKSFLVHRKGSDLLFRCDTNALYFVCGKSVSLIVYLNSVLRL
jgi:hypothetical protein